MKNHIKLIALCTLLSLAWLMPAQAQEQEGDNVARLAMITARDGHEDTLIKAITEYHHWVANFEGHHEYTWFSIETGPNTGKYMARTGEHNWADFDAEYDWQKEANEVFKTNVAPHILKAEVQFTSEMTDFSNWPASFDGYTHFAVEDWYIKNGEYGKFRRGLKKIVDTLKAAGYPNHWGFFSVESGGHGNNVRLVGANKGWSDMAETDPSFFKVMSEALGGEDEFNAFMSDWGSTFKTGLSQVVKIMPEASDYGND
jgi:hypothetical protein